MPKKNLHPHRRSGKSKNDPTITQPVAAAVQEMWNPAQSIGTSLVRTNATAITTRRDSTMSANAITAPTRAQTLATQSQEEVTGRGKPTTIREQMTEADAPDRLITHEKSCKLT